jgi:hypothetical protein
MNQSVINNIFPELVPKINTANNLPNPAINVFGGMGGTSGLNCGYGGKNGTNNLCEHACYADDHSPQCGNFCDKQVRAPSLLFGVC